MLAIYWTSKSIVKLVYCFCRYNGVEGLHTKVTEFVKDKDCLVCGPGVLVELDTTVTLQKVNFLLLMDLTLWFCLSQF